MDRSHPAWMHGYYESMAESARDNYWIAKDKIQEARYNAKAPGKETYTLVPTRKPITIHEMEERAQKAGDSELDAFTHSYTIAKLPYEDQRANRMAVGHARYLQEVKDQLVEYDRTKALTHQWYAVAIIWEYKRLYGELSPELESARITVEQAGTKMTDEQRLAVFRRSAHFAWELEEELNASDGPLALFSE